MESLQPTIKQGYKQTELGIIPEDWKVGKLKRFWIVTDCKHLTAKFINSGIPLASIKEVQSRFVDLRNAKQTTPFYYEQLIDGGRKPLPGDLIFSRNATVGEVAQVAGWHPSFAMGQDVCLLRKKSSDLSSDYLQTVLQSPLISDQITNLMVGSTFKRVNIEQIKNLVVPMPSPGEQHAIADALSDVDALITSLDKLITKKRNIKQGAMQLSLTGKKRLAGFICDWETKTLGEITQIKTGPFGSSLHEKDYVADGTPIITVEHLGERGVTYENLPMVSDFDRKRLNAYSLLPDDIVFSRVGSVDRNSLIRDKENGWLFSGRLLRIRPNKKEVASAFLSHLFHYEPTKQMIRAVAVGQTMPSLNTAIMKAIKLTLPIVEEQKAIAQVLSDMDAEIESLEKKRDKYKAIKQGMMQELLTGKTRLV